MYCFVLVILIPVVALTGALIGKLCSRPTSLQPVKAPKPTNGLLLALIHWLIFIPCFLLVACILFAVFFLASQVFQDRKVARSDYAWASGRHVEPARPPKSPVFRHAAKPIAPPSQNGKPVIVAPLVLAQNGNPPQTTTVNVGKPAVPAAPPKTIANTPSAWTIEVLGRGETPGDAEEDALQRGRTALIGFLRDQDPPIEWIPTDDAKALDYIKKKMLKEPPKNEGTIDLEGLPKMYQVRLKLELNPQTAAEILKLDRHQRMEERMRSLAVLLGGMVAILIASAGYIRLDEWSKGYYTGALRFAAASLVLAAGAGVAFLFTR